MAVKITNLWGNGLFNQLHNNSKLLYIYLTSNPSINSVGVSCLTPDFICSQLCLTIEEMREASIELINNKYIIVKDYNEVIYFIVPKHFSTVGNSESNIEKMKSDLKALPKELKEYLDSIGISVSKKFKPFDEPSAEEIEAFAMDRGFLINGQEVIDYYRGQAKLRGLEGQWVDSRGKRVRDWKGKVINVWIKKAKEIILPDNAPEEYKYLRVFVNGEYYTPSDWKDGQPQHKDFLIRKELIKEYERWKKRS